MDFTKVRVLLVDGGARQTLTILHGLKEIGCHVTVLCSSKADVCYNSKLPDKKILNRDAAGSYDGFEDAVFELVKSGVFDVLLPVAEITTDKVTRQEEKLSKYVRLACAPRSAYIQAFNKQKTLQKAMEIGIPCPNTRRDGQSVDEYLASARFPVIVKPRQGMGSIGFHKYDTEKEIREAIENKIFDPDQYVIQEFVLHERRHGTYIFVDQNGEVKSSLASEVLRWYPIDAGTSTISASVDDSEVIHYAGELMKAIGWKGFANVGFMISKETGKPYLLEINGRIPAPMKLTWMCGINVAKQLIEMAYDEEVTFYPENTKFGMMARHTQADVLWFLKSPNRFRAKPSWFSWKNTSDLVYWKGDLKPFFTYTFHKLFKIRDAMEKRKR